MKTQFRTTPTGRRPMVLALMAVSLGNMNDSNLDTTGRHT